MDPSENLERLLRGDSADSPEEHRLGAFLDEVQAAFPTQPMFAEEAHVAAITDAARIRVVQGDRASIVGAGPEAGSKERRRATMRVPRFRSLAAKLVAVFVVIFVSFGGLAVAGALPSGVQSGVADAVSGVGIDLPGGSDEESDVVEPSDETESPEPEETESPQPQHQSDNQAVSQVDQSDDQGEAEDDQGEDQDDQGENQDDQGENQDDQGADSDSSGGGD